MFGVAIYTIMRQDIGFFPQQLWPVKAVMSLVVWACTSVVFIGDLEKASSLI